MDPLCEKRESVTMQVFDFSPMKLSLNTCVNLLALNGRCVPLRLNARIHSFNANSDLLISAPSIPVNNAIIFARVSSVDLQPADRGNYAKLTGLSVGGRRVCSPLVTSKIDQREFSVNLERTRYPCCDLENGMGSRRVGICTGLTTRSGTVSMLYQLQHFVASLHHLFR